MWPQVTETIEKILRTIFYQAGFSFFTIEFFSDTTVMPSRVSTEVSMEMLQESRVERRRASRPCAGDGLGPARPGSLLKEEKVQPKAKPTAPSYQRICERDQRDLRARAGRGAALC